MKRLRRSILVILALIAVVILGIKLRYGGGEPNPPRTIGAAILPESVLETVATLPTPPGNVAVSEQGRVFITLHPEAKPPYTLAEIVNGNAQPWPNEAAQTLFHDAIGIRIDSQNRLWVIDNGKHGLHDAHLIGFDIAKGAVAKNFKLDRHIAGLGSHMNDLAITPDARWAFIADASIFALKPAIVVINLATGEARRILENDPSVTASTAIPTVTGRVMRAFGIFSVRPNVDSIALSHDGAWLYFAAVNSPHLYRAKTTDLLDTTLNAATLAKRVEKLPPKTMTDGITTDAAGNVYLSALEHSAVIRYEPNTGSMTTLVQSHKIRWPDGFGFGPEGWLYLTDSSLQHIIGLPSSSVAKHAPYHVYRFQPHATAKASTSP